MEKTLGRAAGVFSLASAWNAHKEGRDGDAAIDAISGGLMMSGNPVAIAAGTTLSASYNLATALGAAKLGDALLNNKAGDAVFGAIDKLTHVMDSGNETDVETARKELAVATTSAYEQMTPEQKGKFLAENHAKQEAAETKRQEYLSSQHLASEHKN
jgi:hypothetical protein